MPLQPRFTPDERAINVQNLLIPSFLTIAQSAGVPSTGSNIGYFDGDYFVLPQFNGGTTLALPKAVEDYEYIDILIQGTFAHIRAFDGNLQVFNCDSGTDGVDNGEYSIRIPNVGKIDTLEFVNFGTYTIKAINVYFQTKYYREQENTNLFDITRAGGTWKQDGEGRYYSDVPSLGSRTILLPRSLPAGCFGKLLVELSTGASVSWISGGFTHTLGPRKNYEIILLEDDTLLNYSSLVFSNSSASTIRLIVQPVVGNWSPRSSAWGASNEEDIDQIADWYVDSVYGSDSNDGISSATPFATLGAAAAVVADNEVIALKRGSTFRERWNVSASITGFSFVAYGEGRKPVISAFEEVPSGEITYVGGNTFLTIAHDFVDNYSNFQMLFENGQQLVYTGAVDTGVTGTYCRTGLVGFVATFKVYPLSRDNGATGAVYDATTRKYFISHRPYCMRLNDDCSVDNIWLEGNQSNVSPVLVAGCNTRITNCVVEKYINCGVVQVSGIFAGNLILNPGINTSAENNLGKVYAYCSQKTNEAPFDGTSIDNSHDSDSLLISGNEFNSGQAAGMLASRDFRGIYLLGEHGSTTIDGNAIINFRMPLETQDVSAGNALTFSNNYIRNWTTGILINGPYCKLDGNWFFLDVRDPSLAPSMFLEVTGIGGLVEFMNNLLMTKTAFNTFRIDVSNNLQIHNNAIFSWNAGDAAAGPLLRCDGDPTFVGLYKNYLHGVQVVVFNFGGVAPPVGTTDHWNNNAYSGIKSYPAMFTWNGVVYTSVASWALVFDTLSVVNSAQMPRAEKFGDLTPTVLTPGVGPSSFDTSRFLMPKHPSEIYAL